MDAITEGKLRYMEFLQREEGSRHHSNSEDAYQYALLKVGDPRAPEEARKMFASRLTGHVSDDPLRNLKYLFVASATLASRAAISVGMEDERAFNISDLFIRQMDLLQSLEAVRELQAEMIAYYTKEVAALDKKKIWSRDVLRGMDYIYEHLHESLSARDVAAYVGLSRSYYSTLFKNDTGVSLSGYILGKRVEAAKNMLSYSDIPLAEISAILAFSSQSHFNRVFRQQTGYTPRSYRMRFSERSENTAG
ncbi:MAG: helix-turn-helix transcriptional regulator [Oscillospiraceae bacterium]|nr:helix-turn-helix transcriptional regulator [Oscillospiraceae bacterium]